MSLKYSKVSAIDRWGDKSPLRSKIIKQTILKKRDYTIGDFEFKIKNEKKTLFPEFDIEVSHFEKIILKISFMQIDNEKFEFIVEYFNPQTLVDAQAINHFIAQAKELLNTEELHRDKGNVDILNNQYVFKKRPTFYSYPLVWSKGHITKENFDKELSYEFATEMYLSQIKKVYKPKRLQRKKIKNFMNDTIGMIKKEKILESFEKKEEKSGWAKLVK